MRRSQPWRRPSALLLLGAALLAAGPSCTPVVEQSEPPAYVLFDTASDPPRIHEPNNVLLDRESGRLDFGRVGVTLPADPLGCPSVPDLSVAQCELDLYLQGLDGFPTLTPLTVPVSVPLDPTSFTFSGTDADTVVVIDASELLRITDLEVTYDAEAAALRIVRTSGWDLGRTYVAGIRGYDGGVRGAAGERVVGSFVYPFLRLTESLITCLPDPPDPAELEEPVTPSPGCKYVEFFLEEAGSPEEGLDALVALETLRRDLQTDGVWTHLASEGSLTKEEAAAAWAFRVHSATVAELEPSTDRVPEQRGADRIFVPVRGSVDASSLSPSSLDVPPFLVSTVILLDLTALEQDDYAGGFPAFAVEVTEEGIALRTAAALTPGRSYGILLTTSDGAPGSRAAVRDRSGRPIVPSPITVLLRSRGAIVDVDGRSLVSSASDADAAELVEGRQALRPLLDNAFFMDLAQLTRENIAYLYALEIP